MYICAGVHLHMHEGCIINKIPNPNYFPTCAKFQSFLSRVMKTCMQKDCCRYSIIIKSMNACSVCRCFIHPSLGG